MSLLRSRQQQVQICGKDSGAPLSVTATCSHAEHGWFVWVDCLDSVAHSDGGKCKCDHIVPQMRWLFYLC